MSSSRKKRDKFCKAGAGKKSKKIGSMKNIVKQILVAVLLAPVITSQAFARIQVVAQVDTSEDIYVGESFTYNLIIDGENKPGQADLASLARYNPQSAGNRDVSQSSVTIINGKMSRTETKRYVMSYALTAGRAGRVQLPSITVTIDGKNYRTNPVELNILQPGNTDKLDLEVKLSDTSCYVGQPVIMTVNFYILADIGDFQFNIPALDSGKFYIQESDKLPKGAKQYRLTNGMIVTAGQFRTTHKGKDAILLTFNKVLIPKSSGTIQLRPASVSANVAVGRQKRRGSIFDDFFGRTQYKRFMVKSKPLALSVQPLPQQSKPAEFYGLVGRYAISASASPTEVNRGDPITLTIEVGPNKYLKPVQWPALEQIPEMTQNFKIPSEKSSPTIEKGHKIFTQTIRPNNNNVTRIPPIPLAFFDVDKGEYVVAKTEPIKLEVTPTKKLTSADLQGRDFAPISKEVEAIRKGLSANYENLDALTNQSFSPLAAAISLPYAPVWALPFAALVVSSLIKLFTHTTPEKIAAVRRRRAGANAIADLKKISHHTSGDTHELLATAMKKYLGQRFDRTAASLTAQDCHRIIVAASEDIQAADKYRDIIDLCESARYAAAQADIDSDKIAQVIKLIRDIEKKSKK
ncbi:MAG: BatD family protein [Planctomycetota bacterium]|jgi:hypothetical protein